jgi:YidC/Oxa1 family membrane protein insertase
MKGWIRKAVWAVFAAWNIFILFVILGRKEIEPTEIESNLVIKQEKIKEIEIKTFQKESEKAIYNFSENASLNSIVLKNYKEQVDSNKLEIIQSQSYLKWEGDVQVPNKNTIWNKSEENDTINFSWKNKDGITFNQSWKIDDSYGIKLSIFVQNPSEKRIKVKADYIMKKEKMDDSQSFIFTGITSLLNDKLTEISASSLKENIISGNSGWISFNEKYWLNAIASNNFKRIEVGKNVKDNKDFKIKAQENTFDLEPMESKTTDFALYFGPKKVKDMSAFSKKYNVSRLDESVDYGWLFFLTKPVNAFLNFLIEKFSSVAIALVALTLILKGISWPLTASSQRSMKKMQKVGPEINAIKERFKGNQALISQEIFALYKREKINPVSGCLPMVLQILLLFPLYKVLSFSIELRYAPFFFWIKDLSGADPTSWTNLFGILPWNALEFLKVGAWPFLMGISMFFQQKLSSSTMEQNPAMTYGLPVFFTWMMSTMPAGVVIYWTITNVLSIIQAIMVNKEAD